MPIITIYQDACDESEALAKSVAEALGYRCIGREVLIEASRCYGAPEAKLNDIVETGPHWWERLLQDIRPYRIALQAALCELALDGKIVYHGHLGHELLQGIRHVLKVLVTEPLETRVMRLCARLNLTAASARHYVQEIDRARSRRLMAMFGTDWRDVNRYDLVVNLNCMRPSGAQRMIIEAAKLDQYQPNAASIRAYDDLALSSRVHATLCAAPALRGLDVNVRAEDGHIYIKGTVAHDLAAQLIRKVKYVPGVTDVTSDLYVSPPQGCLQL